jgi:hypothetical protein
MNALDSEQRDDWGEVVASRIADLFVTTKKPGWQASRHARVAFWQHRAAGNGRAQRRSTPRSGIYCTLSTRWQERC